MENIDLLCGETTKVCFKKIFIQFLLSIGVG